MEERAAKWAVEDSNSNGNADSWRATSTLRALLAVYMISTRRHVTHVADGCMAAFDAEAGLGAG
jgi:hypothetical protein